MSPRERAKIWRPLVARVSLLPHLGPQVGDTFARALLLNGRALDSFRRPS